MAAFIAASKKVTIASCKNSCTDCGLGYESRSTSNAIDLSQEPPGNTNHFVFLQVVVLLLLNGAAQRRVAPQLLDAIRQSLDVLRLNQQPAPHDLRDGRGSGGDNG